MCDRRRKRQRRISRPDALALVAADRGEKARDQLLKPGYSMKPSHRGIGLYLVAETVARTRGTLRFEITRRA